MTVVIRSERIGNYAVEISQDKYESTYKVSLNRMISDYEAVRENENYYPDIKKATARYNRLKRSIR